MSLHRVYLPIIGAGGPVTPPAPNVRAAPNSAMVAIGDDITISVRVTMPDLRVLRCVLLYLPTILAHQTVIFADLGQLSHDFSHRCPGMVVREVEGELSGDFEFFNVSLKATLPGKSTIDARAFYGDARGGGGFTQSHGVIVCATPQALARR